jgi:hypothetical protein
LIIVFIIFLNFFIFFKFLGMHQQADAIEAQIKTRQPTPGAPPTGGNMMPGKLD